MFYKTLQIDGTAKNTRKNLTFHTLHRSSLIPYTLLPEDQADLPRECQGV